MKSIKIIRATICNGKTAKVGEIFEVSDAEARMLFSYKKAEPAPEKQAKVTKKKAAKK